MKLSTDKAERARSALEQGKIKLAFQPIFDGEGGFDKAEVLCRLEYEGGIVMPNDFIPFAEESGYIDDLTRGVLRELGRCVSAHAFPALCFCINVSPIQLQEQGFAGRFCAWARESGLSCRALIVEITESAAYEFGGIVKENLSVLYAAGCSLAVDDFGKGSSDLRKMSELPVGLIKIDKMYIDRIEESAVERMLRSVIGYARLTGKKCVAEGVEKAAQKQILEKLKCHYYQGYFFSRPLYAEDFLTRLSEKDANGCFFRPRALSFIRE